VSDSHELTPEDVKEILRLVDESGFQELELETPRFTVRFRRGADAAVDSSDAKPRAEPGNVPPVEAGQLLEVTAPMVGTFYVAPAPGAPPFVEVGGPVGVETTVCVIEVMKLMSSIPAGVSGTIVEICVANATPIQYGDVLFRVLPR
jgi:acetyl-CoA carboxylase biotin carboxyl carrier protein